MDTTAILAVRRSEPEPPRGGPHFWPLILLMLVLLAVAVAYLGPAASPVATTSATPTPTDEATREPRVYAVSYRAGVFSPTNLRIHVGDTVRWKNDSPVPIRVIAQVQQGAKVPIFDSVGLVQPDSSFSFTFSTVGVFGYYNPSDANESGVVIVR